MAAATPSLLTRRRVVTVLVATLLLLASVPFLWPSSASQVTYFLPRPHTAVTFHRNPALFDLSSNADGNWSALLPPNGGFVVEKNEFGGLEMAGITMFHQLHCLGMIRNAIQELMIDKPMNMENVIGRRHGLHFHQEHWVHCLDYLVQGILCSADPTIEAAHESGDGEGRRVDGYEVRHQCRDPDALWATVMGEMSLPGWYEIGLLSTR